MKNKPSKWVELGIISALALALFFAALMLLLAGCATSPAANGEFVDPGIVLSTAISSDVRTDPTAESPIRPTQDLSTIQMPDAIYPAVIPAGIPEGPDAAGAWGEGVPADVVGWATWDPAYKYEAMSITSPIVHIYHYQDWIKASGCTWVLNADGSVQEIWLHAEDGYILAQYKDMYPFVLWAYLDCEVVTR